MRDGSHILACLALAIWLLALPQGVWATSATWSNGVGTFNYNTLNNWAAAPASIPGTGAGETATFTNAGVGNVGISAATAYGVGFAFSNTSGNNYIITVADGVQQALTGVTTTGAGNVTFATIGTCTYTLTGSIPFNLVSGQTTTVSSAVTNGLTAGGINEQGQGTLVLFGTNTYTGGTTLTSGMLKIGSDKALGTGTLTLNGGDLQSIGTHTVANAVTQTGTAFIDGAVGDNLTLSGIVTLVGPISLVATNAGNTTLTNVISGAGFMVQAGNGILTLSGANKYTGTTYLDRGTLVAGSSSVLNSDGSMASGPFGTGTLSLAGGTLQARGSQTVSNAVSLSNTSWLGGGPIDKLTLTGDINLWTYTLGNIGSGTNTLSGTIKGAGGSIIQNHGTLILSGDNNYGGDTTVNGGILIARGGDNRLSMYSITTIAQGATLNLTNTNQDFVTLNGAGTLTGTGLITVGAGTFSGVISGSGGRLVVGSIVTPPPGTLTLTGHNTYSGGTILNIGTLAVGNNVALGTGPLTIEGGTLEASGGAITLANQVTVGGNFTVGGASPLTLRGKVDLNPNRTLIVANTANTTLSGVVSGAGAIEQQTGTLTLSGGNTYNGGTTLINGTLVAGNNAAFGAGPLVFDSGWLQASGSHTVSNAVVVNGSFSLGGSPTDKLTLTSDLDLGSHWLNSAGTGTNTLSGVISGSGVVENFYGMLVLTGANTYTGGTWLGSGTLVAGSSSVLKTNGTGTIDHGPLGTDTLKINGFGTLAASGAARTLDNLVEVHDDFALGTGVAATNQNLTLSGAVTLYTTPTITVNNTTEITGAIGESGSSFGITKAGRGTLILSGANTYSGDTTVNAGTLIASGWATNANRLSATGITTIAPGATLNLTNTTQTFADLEGAGRLITGTGILTVKAGTFSGVISGSSGRLLKDGGGTLTLSGANTYILTTLKQGTLAVANNTGLGHGLLLISGGILVASGAPRTLANPVNVYADFTLGGAEPLTLSGKVDLGAASRTLTITNTANTTLSGVISDTPPIFLSVKNTGGAILTLSGANTYIGTVLYSGILAAGSSSVVTGGAMVSGPFGKGILVLNGGTLAASGSRTVSNPVAVNGSFSLGGGPSDKLTLTSDLALGDYNYWINNLGGTNTLPGEISGTSGGIATTGGTLILTGANTYGGGTSLFNGGTLVVGSSSVVTGGAIVSGPFGKGILVLNGGTLAASSAARTLDNAVSVYGDFALGTGVAATNQNLTLSGAVTLYATPTITVNNTTEIQGSIGGSYGLTKAGRGTLILSGVNTYTGYTRVNAGTLVAGKSTAVTGGAIVSGPFGTSGLMTIAPGATLNLIHTAQTFADLEGAGSLTGIGGITVYGGDFSGVISGSGLSLLKDQSGTLTLSGANTYTGDTTLRMGTLAAGNNKALGTGLLSIGGGTLAASGTARTLTNPVDVFDNFVLGTGVAATNQNLTLSGAVTLCKTATITVNNTTEIKGAIGQCFPGGYGIAMIGPGTLILSGANTYSGGTTLNYGILAAGSSSVLKPDKSIASGPFGTGPLTLNGGWLQASGIRTVSNPVTLTHFSYLGGGLTDKLTLTGKINLGGNTLWNNWNGSTGTNTLAGSITDTGVIVQSAGTLILSGANTYSGGTYLDGGTLVAGNSSSAGPPPSGPFGTGTLFIYGGTLTASGAPRTLDNAIDVHSPFALGTGVAATNQNLTLSGAVTLYGSTPTITVYNTTEIKGAIGQYLYSFGIEKAGPGTLILSGDNTYTGHTRVNAGTLVAGSSSILNPDGTIASSPFGTSGLVAIAPGATLNLTNTSQTFADLEGAGSLTGTGTITVNAGTFSGVISGTGGSLVKNGFDALTLSGANTYTGGTTFNSGTLVAGNNKALGTGPLTINGGTLAASGAPRTLANPAAVYNDFALGTGVEATNQNLTLSGAVTLYKSATFNVNNTTTIQKAIGQSGGNYGITKTGPGTLVLSGANNYSGGTTLYGGILAAGNNAAFGPGPMTIYGGTIQASGSRTASNTVNVNGNFSLGGGPSDKLTLTSDLALGNYYINNLGGTNTLSGVISGSGGGIATMGGTLTLTGANTYSGGTTLNSGNLVAGNNAAFGTGPLALNGGTLAASGGARTLDNPVDVYADFALGTGVAATNQNLTLSGAVTLYATPTIAVNNTTTIQGSILGDFTKAGRGTLILSGTTSGGTTVKAGTLIARGADNRLSTTGITDIAKGATLNLTNTSQTFAYLEGAGSLTGTGVITVDAGAFSGVISGTGGRLIKDSAGTLTLSGADTYNGGTTLKMGTLAAGNNKAFGTGPLTIWGGTLAASGTKTVMNAITMITDFTLDGGASDNLTLTSSINLGLHSIINNGLGTNTLSGVLSGAGGNIVQNSGTLVLSGANPSLFTETVLNGGTLVAGNNNALGQGYLDLFGGTLAASGAPRTLANSTVYIGGNFSLGTGVTATNQNLTLSGDVTLKGSSTITVNNTTEVKGAISGGYGIIKAGPGTLILSGDNTYSGGTILTLGTLAAGNNAAFGTGPLAIQGGTLAASGGARTLDKAVGVYGDFALGTGVAATNQNLTFSGNVTLLATPTITVNNTTEIEGAINQSGGSFGFIKAGRGTLILSGANNYGGDTTITAGTLIAASGADNRLNPTGTTTIAAGATLNLTYTNQDFTMLNGAGSLTGTGVTTVYGGDFSGVISGSGGSLVKNGFDALTLSGANTYTGGTTFNSGTLTVGNNKALGTGPLTINGGTLAASGAARTLANPAAVYNDFALGTGVEVTNQNLTLSGAVTLYKSATITVNNTTTIQKAIGQSGGNYGITKAGPGTLILSGANTYSGDTTVNNGALTLGGGATGRLLGKIIVNSGIFNLTSTNATALASGAVSVAGSGIFNMGAGSKYNAGAPGLNLPAGATFTSAAASNLTVGSGGLGFNNQGTAWVNGTVSGDFTNMVTGFLGGTGKITGTLVNNGTIQPGNPTGVLTVGAYMANTGSNTIINIASATSYSRIVASKPAAGSITLIPGATLTPTLVNGYIPPGNKVFRVLQASGAGGTVKGTFTTLANQQISPTLSWQVLYGANFVNLIVDPPDYTAASLSLDPAQATVGNMLNAFASVTSGDMYNVLNAINGLTTNEQVAAAYNEILPLKYASLPSLTFPVTRMQFQYLRDRMARLRQGLEFGGGFMSGLADAYNPGMLLAANNVASDAGNPLIRQGMEQRWGAYLDPLVNWGSQSNISGQPGYDYTNAGVTLGADYWLLKNLLVGLNTGYNHTGTSIGGTGGSIEVNSIPFNAYSCFFIKGFYVNGVLGYTHNDYYNMERNIVIGTLSRNARASTSGNQFQLAAETGYDFKTGHAIFGPTLSLYYLTLTTDAFTESNGGSLNLRVPGQTADSVQTGLGARAALKAKMGNVTLVPQVSAVWQHEYSNNTRGVNARLAQGSSFISFQTKEPGRDFAVLNVDLSAKFTKNIMANVGYTAEAGRHDSSNMGVNVGLRINF